MGRHGLDWSGPGLGTGGGRLWVQLWTFWFQKMRGISWLVENQLASQGGPCSMALDRLLLYQIVLAACKIPVIQIHSPSWETKGRFTHSMTRPCHAVPLRVWNVSLPFDLHSAAVSDSHLPCRAHAIPDHAVLLKATAHDRRETPCGLTASVRLLPAITRSSTKLLSDVYQSQMQVASVKPNIVTDEEKSGSSTLQKDVLLPFRIFPATMRIFTKDAALSEQGRGAGWHVWNNARRGRGTAWARHAMCDSAFMLPRTDNSIKRKNEYFNRQ